MSSWSDSLMDIHEQRVPAQAGPLERLWQVNDSETMFLSVDEIHRREQAAYRRGEQGAERRLRSEYESALTAARSQFLQSLSGFQEQRSRYFAEMESEVVRLALALGRTVVERELESDPTLLSTPVRDVLERVERNSKLRLKVPAEDIASWEKALAMEIESGLRIEIAADGSLSRGQCVVVSALGKSEFDIAERLRTIEAAMLEAQRSPASEPRIQ